jgi:acylphosphatase
MAIVSRARLRISGRVQGVFYRQTTREKARALGLSGWVRNMPDGTVEAEARGPRERIDELITWCRQGPPSATVANVMVEWTEDDDTPAAPGRFDIM